MFKQAKLDDTDRHRQMLRTRQVWTCDDKGVFDDDDTYSKWKYPMVGRRLIPQRV